jgi:hypothetical protein
MSAADDAPDQREGAKPCAVNCRKTCQNCGLGCY